MSTPTLTPSPARARPDSAPLDSFYVLTSTIVNIMGTPGIFAQSNPASWRSS